MDADVDSVWVRPEDLEKLARYGLYFVSEGLTAQGMALIIPKGRHSVLELSELLRGAGATGWLIRPSIDD